MTIVALYGHLYKSDGLALQVGAFHARHDGEITLFTVDSGAGPRKSSL